MKIRTVRHLMKEGIVNVIRQRMMSLATIFIVIASFVVLGIFLILLLNVNELSTLVSKEPEMIVYCKYKLDDGEIFNVEKALKNNYPEIASITKISREEALEKIKNDVYAGKADAIVGLTPDIMPVSFVIKLKDPTQGLKIIPNVEKIPGVESVGSPLGIVNMIVGAQSWIRIITIILILLLMGISILIISNAIKLTVHSRKKEVGIMKNIGATDAYIKLPFIIEGMIMGMVGSVLAFMLISLMYNAFPSNFGLMNEGLFGQFRLVKFDNIIKIPLFGIAEMQFVLGAIVCTGFVLLGIIMGAAGSAISIKKYLKLRGN
ncbi:MAG: permease-like cell division protein FtsX [Bacillota bacterium]